MHHRQTIFEDVNGSEHAGVENSGAAFALEERKTAEHDDVRAERQRVIDKFSSEPVGRIGQD
jgi:hypothetical protein